MDRKKRMQGSRMTSSSVQSAQPSNPILPSESLRQIFSQSGASAEVSKAIGTACSLVSNGTSSMGNADLLRISRLLDDLRTKVSNELKERNGGVF